MELGTARTTPTNGSGSQYADDAIVEQRLASLLELNAEALRERTMYRSDRERIDASLMTRPVDSKKAFAYFGLIFGALPPFALVFKIIGETTPYNQSPMLFLVLLSAAGVGTGVAGYATGRIIPSLIERIEKVHVANRLALLALTGFGWGAVSGAVGGLFLFIIGSMFAAIVGGIIGSVALPVLVGLRAPLRRGDFIELKHFLPIVFGITLTLCAFILGF
jgi:MFS family permease